ncbi:MAG: hypothetical protein A2V98_25885 [Planctomycetes bacterium RBG_16_64_12]|nr:MAG: hypothetical protein A2V98_25885 [Planctomycetes bacterium RBG_16_64_12]
MFNLTLEHKASFEGRDRIASKSYSGGSTPRLDESIPDESTDLLVNYALDVSAIQAIHIQSDQDITVKTNSSSVPDETLALVAGVAYVWTTDSYFANVLETDITKFYVTNASGAAANLVIEAVVDPTPA